jgi:hypothetical protein
MAARASTSAEVTGMFKAVRNIIIVVALLAAGVATYVTLAPSQHPHAVVVVNRSGQAAGDVALTVSDLSGQTLGTATAANLAEGQSLAAGHDLKTVQMSLIFTLAGQPHEYSNPYLDFSSGTRWTFEIQPEGAIKLSAPRP